MKNTREFEFTDRDLAWFRGPLRERSLAEDLDTEPAGSLLGWFVLVWTAELIFLGAAMTGCVSLPHVDPLPRNPVIAAGAVVQVYSTCTEEDPFNTPVDVIPGHHGPDIEWMPAHSGSGVVVSERHILTADHVVACPVIPVVHVRLGSGRVVRAVVTEEDPDADVARLEIAYADNFGLGIAPPALAAPRDVAAGDRLCAHAGGRVACGYYDGPASGFGVYGTHTGPGWSGAGVYTADGRLVGLVIAGSAMLTKFTFVGAKWLAGT